MLDPLAIARYLTLAYAALAAGLVVRLAAARLLTRYKFLAGFLIVDICLTFALLATPYQTNAYGWIWISSRPLLVVCYFFVVLELYRLVLRDYPGIAGLFRGLISVCVPLAVLISLAPLVPALSSVSAPPYPLLGVAVVMHRTAVLVILVFIAVLEIILFWYPLNLSRNTVFYCAGYLVFFTAQTAGLSAIAQIGVQVAIEATVLMQAVSCSCFLFWILTLGSLGEVRELVVGASWRLGERERMREQLRAINSALFRLVRFTRIK